MKQIVFTGVNQAELLSVEMPAMSDDEVLVKLAYTTVSGGTEKAGITGETNIGPVTQKVAVFPRYFGYSGAGVVEKVGKNVKRFQVGDRVACFWGVHAQYAVYDETRLVKVPDGVSLREAAIALIATFPMAAIRKTYLEYGESAIVMGLGVLGLIGVKLLKVAGAVPVIAADPVPERRELALKCGADYAFDPLASDFVEQVKAVTNGGVNVAIEVTGMGAGLNEALDCMARYGRISLLGCTRKFDFTVDYYKKVHLPGITIVGAHTAARPKFESAPGYWTERDDVEALFRLILHGRMGLGELLSEVHSPADAPAVYDRLIHDKNFPIGLQFDWSRLVDKS